MKTSYRHLSIEERDRLAVYRSKGMSLRKIASLLGRSHSTVVREIKRNAPPIRTGYYLAHKAESRAVTRRKLASSRKRLKSRRIRSYVAKMIRKAWSPELIAGRIKFFKWTERISPEAIYQWIYLDESKLISYLTRANRKRKKRGYSRKHSKSHIPGRIAIEERPAGAQNRSRFGHWEADTITSRASRPVIQILVERKARYSILNKLPDRKAASMRKTMNKSMCKLPKSLLKTFTYDNGVENTEHQLTNATLGTRSYFCAPYTSQEKGTVENTAGLVRRFFPKRTNFDKISHKQVKRVEKWLNNRPRKCLDYFTPAEVFSKSGALRG